ncbi:MAG: hypothetical protein ACKOAH_28865, partial [Pirellula sp.]
SAQGRGKRAYLRNFRLEHPVRKLPLRAPARKRLEANEIHTLCILCLLDLQILIVYLAKG